METSYPSIDHYGPIKTPYGHPYPPMNRYGPINQFYTPLQDLSRPLRTILYSIADISKQVNKGQKKWRQGVDVMSIDNVNDYIKFKTLKYKYFKFINNNL